MEPSCAPDSYRWANDRTNGLIFYEGSGLCNACFLKDAGRTRRLMPLSYVCPYCGADIANRLEQHTDICRFKGMLAAEEKAKKEER